MIRRLFRFETLTLVLLAGALAAAENVPVAPWGGAAAPAPAPAPAMTPALPGRPVVIPTTAVPLANPQTTQDTNALTNAFGQILNMLGGGGANGGRSEIVGSGHDGSAGSSGYNGTGSITPVGAADLGGPRKIIPPFRKWFAECTKKYGECKFQNWGIMGDASHRARRSCHNAGEAIDVGPITCSGGQSFPSNSAEFFNIAKCLANDSNNELQVIFHKAEGPGMIRKSDHVGHMHVQLKNCNMTYGMRELPWESLFASYSPSPDL